MLEHLESNDTYACGTVRVNRTDLPPCAKDKLRAAGEKVVRQKGKVVFTKWHDKRDVSFLSTNCSPLAPDVHIQRNNQSVSKPAVVDQYNKNMGGVDLADQLRKYYSVGRTSYRWYRYIFWFIVDVSICNAFILYNHYRVSQGQGKVKQLAFRTNLAKQLIAGFSSTVSVPHSAKRRRIEDLSNEPGNSGKHFIVKIDGRKKECVYCKMVGNKTPKGRAVESSFKCIQCSVALCKTCFNNYHTL